MKIIEKKDFSKWTYQFACKRCESKLEAEPNDVVAQYHEGYTDMREPGAGRAYWTYHVQCAVCNDKHQIDSSSIPKGMQHEVQERSQRRNTTYHHDR